MSCAPPSERTWSRRYKLSAKAKLDPVEVDGTWDFKWRKDATIRVAFQSPPAGDRAEGVDQAVIPKLIDIARLWQTRIKIGSGPVEPTQAQVPLTLHFLTDQILPTPPPGWTDGPKLGLDKAVRYDALISLATLPLTIPAHGRRRAREVFLPRSELGRYARRLEYGIPSAFLGAFRPEDDLARFSGTPEWQHVVVHELGHILGLAHPYQQHDASVSWKADDQLKELLPGLIGREMTDEQLDEYIDLQLKAQLPAPGPEGPPFSDFWPDPSVDLPSVMNPAFIAALVEGSAKAHANGVHDWRTEPSEADLAYLRSMYTPGPN